MERELWQGWSTVQKIGSGSYGNVYEIERQIFGEREKAALKVIHIPQRSEETDELRGMGFTEEGITLRYRNYLEEIVREYSLMAKFKGNSNIVACDDIRYEARQGEIGWTVLIKMELLTPILKIMDRLSCEEEVIRLGMDICRALCVCKKRNIIHRDIKPQNIFVGDNGDYKLGDFGIAKVSERISGGTKAGTFNFMAPEVNNNRPYGTSADLYSLGLVLYWLLNRLTTPFLPLPPQVPTSHMGEEALTRRFRGEALPEPVNGSPELKAAVLKACAFDPDDRFRSPEELLDVLSELAYRGKREDSESREKEDREEFEGVDIDATVCVRRPTVEESSKERSGIFKPFSVRREDPRMPDPVPTPVSSPLTETPTERPLIMGTFKATSEEPRNEEFKAFSMGRTVPKAPTKSETEASSPFRAPGLDDLL